MKKTLNVQRHERRPVRPLGLHEIRDWRVKLYGVCSVAEVPALEFTSVALELANGCLPPISDTCYGLGFATIHQAEAFNQIIVDWWEHNNELRHRVFKALPHAPLHFTEITATGEAFCVWELAVICHEREAWLRHVLTLSPDVEAYLSDVLSGEF